MVGRVAPGGDAALGRRCRVLTDVEALARRIEQAPRPWRNYSTAVGEALFLALDQFAAVPQCKRRVIDISGDGFSNEGVEPREAQWGAGRRLG